jgi:hypothetical protein
MYSVTDEEMNDTSLKEFVDLVQTVKTFIGDSFEWDHSFMANLYQKVN